MYKDEKFWDRIASNFDKIEANDISYKIFIEKARGYLKADDAVLDFGCVLLSSTPCMSEAVLLNSVLKVFSFIGLTPKLNPFTSSDMEHMLIKESFKTIELNRIKPKSPIYICILRKQ